MLSLSQCVHRRTVRHTIRIAVVAVLGSIAASCSEGKVSQCRELINVANQVVADVQTVAQNASATSTTSSSSTNSSPTGATSPGATSSPDAAVSPSATTSTASNSPDSVAVINKVAESAEKARINIEGLQLTDEKLKGFQSQYAAMYTEINQTTRDMLAAAESKDREAGKEAYNAFRAATSREEALVQGVNEYCAVK